MKVPQYIINLMKRSKYEYDFLDDKNASVGYTIRIVKRTDYQKIDTFKKEIYKLKNGWIKNTKKLQMQSQMFATFCQSHQRRITLNNMR